MAPLHLAAMDEDGARGAAHVGWLLAHGAEVEAKDNKGCTALFRAAQVSHSDLWQILLSRHQLLKNVPPPAVRPRAGGRRAAGRGRRLHAAEPGDAPPRA